MTAERSAIVTGGARNIGLGISKRLMADGWRVHVLDIEDPHDSDLAADARRVDLGDASATRAAVDEIAAKTPVTCLVNNVGIVRPASIENLDIEEFDEVMHVNVRSALAAARGAIDGMKRAGRGRIIMNTSRVTKGKIDRSLYSASKGALQSMARTWALELAGHGITVNCVAPGPIATSAFWKNNPEGAPETRRIIDAIPVGRMGAPDDVAQAVSFFADDRSDFITGQTVFVCGGTTVG
ncbi:SDR family oxidoreductase [Roseibacterium beibuensis]|uniref:SDR family oxidoreductase n=2 Tax=[Roseibacterium] beibuensis TaxID=1193142 RepID=A0ABP9LFF4_9RHOB|nr:SDR family oxidoreductase [Roseibacterium beibuensis]MCS6623523.1 SDR family oxidoreductase [Roseibacterium beibuensis]